MARTVGAQMPAAMLLPVFLVWVIGCSTTVPLSSISDVQGRSITVITHEGGSIEFIEWYSDAEGNITGKGETPHPTGHPSLTVPFSGSIAASDIRSISYRSIEMSPGSETVLAITAMTFFTLLTVIVANDHSHPSITLSLSSR